MLPASSSGPGFYGCSAEFTNCGNDGWGTWGDGPTEDSQTEEADPPVTQETEQEHSDGQQQAQEPEPPPIPSATVVPCPGGHMFFGPQEEVPTLGDAVYEPADGRLGSGEVRTQDLSAISAIALDTFVNVTEYYASFTFRIVERSTGNNRTDYEYEISYDQKPDRGEIVGRQKVAADGVVEIGTYRAKSQTTGPAQPLKPFYSGDIDFKRTGAITIYGTNGEKAGTTRFEASVKTIDSAVGDHRVSIVETSRTVGNITWNRPGP